MLKEEIKDLFGYLEKRNFKVLLHIPHSSLKLPRIFYKYLLISKELLNKYNLEMSDLFVNKLFENVKGKKIIAKYSRLYCDVERFKDDRLEVMAKYGQGVVYTNTYDGIFFHKHNEKYKRKVLRYYDGYHKRLDRISKSILDKGYNLLILDCHSFSDKMASHICNGLFSDICIGIEKDFFAQEIFDRIINIIKDKYSYDINYPYKGSIVPNVIYNNKDKYKAKVISMMIEINKRVYL